MRQEPDNKPSYAFGGPLTRQHLAIPFPCFMGNGKLARLSPPGFMQKISNRGSYE